MQELLQHDDLLDLVIAGNKQATVRKGHRDIDLGSLTLKGTDSGREHIVEVNAVEYLTLDDLNQEHAEIDGYNSVDELKTRLTAIYGDLPGDQEMTVIYWNEVGALPRTKRKNSVLMGHFKISKQGRGFEEQLESLKASIKHWNSINITEETLRDVYDRLEEGQRTSISYSCEVEQ